MIILMQKCLSTIFGGTKLVALAALNFPIILVNL